MSKSETFGQRLQRLRLAAGMTQEALAEKAGESVHNVRNWEHDHRRPMVNAVLNLSKALGVPMEELASSMSATKPDKPAPKRKRKPEK